VSLLGRHIWFHLRSWRRIYGPNRLLFTSVDEAVTVTETTAPEVSIAGNLASEHGEADLGSSVDLFLPSMPINNELADLSELGSKTMIETTTPDVLLSINDEFLAASGELGSNTVIGTTVLDVSINGNLTSEYQIADPGSFGDFFPPLLIPISDKFLAELELGSNAVTESTELVVNDLAGGGGEVEIGSFTERAL
jgi:hypothetical protein